MNAFQGPDFELPAEISQNPSKLWEQFCRHEFKLNEEIGILCQLCGYVSTEIKDVSPTFVSKV